MAEGTLSPVDLSAARRRGAQFNPLDHPHIFATPLRLTEKSWWHPHIPFAFWIVESVRPRVLVELGTEAGDSYCAFCQAVDELGTDTSCYAVDTWKGDAHTGPLGPEVLEDLRAHHDPRYSRFSTLLQTSFAEALEHFEDGSIDLIHIDGCHTYDAVKQDFDSWLPKLSKRGVVLLHDTNVRKGNFGVARFWSEIKDRYSHFEFLHGSGLVALAAGPEGTGLDALLALDEEGMLVVRRLFFELGRRFERPRELAAAAPAQLEEAQAARAEAEAALQQLEVAHAAATESTEAMEGLLDGVTFRCKELEQKVTKETTARALAESNHAATEAALVEARAALAQAQEALIETRSERDRLLHSKSIRITAPFRWVALRRRRILARVRRTRPPGSEPEA